MVDLVVTGPMARSAEDLRLELEIIGGPDAEDAVAYQWRLPAPRRPSLKEYRVGYVFDDLFCPVTPEVLAVVSQAVDALRKAGVCLVEGWPPGVKPAEQWDSYYRLSAAASSLFETEETLGPLRRSPKAPGLTRQVSGWRETPSATRTGWQSPYCGSKPGRFGRNTVASSMPS